MPSSATPPLRAAWLVWGLAALFYLMGFFQRVAPAVMTSELMRDFQINAAALGNLSGLYFYSYVAMQIPTGILADSWGPRRLLSLGALVAGTGTMLFALAPNFIWAGIGRFLIGGSVAVAFVGMLQLASQWFPPRLFALVTGMALCFGLIGAVGAGPPLRLLMDIFSWRSVIFASALVTLSISLGVWIIVRDHPHEKGYADLFPRKKSPRRVSLKHILLGVLKVFTYRNTALLFIIPGGIVGCVLTFSGLWGVPFLTTHHGLTTARASGLTSALLVAWGLGGPFFGWLSDHLGHRKPLFILGTSIVLIGWGVILYVPSLPVKTLVGVLIVTGFFSGCMIVSFAFAKESVPPDLSGTVAGVVNMGVMLGPTILQPAVGWLLDRNWNGEMANQVRVYSQEAYQTGFSLMIAWAGLALLLLFFTRETGCRQQA
mgnify:FL=1